MNVLIPGEELRAGKLEVLRDDSGAFTCAGGAPLRKSVVIFSLSFFSRAFLSMEAPSWGGEVNCGDEEGCFFQKELNPLKVDLEELWVAGAATLINGRWVQIA